MLAVRFVDETYVKVAGVWRYVFRASTVLHDGGDSSIDLSPLRGWRRRHTAPLLVDRPSTRRMPTQKRQCRRVGGPILSEVREGRSLGRRSARVVDKILTFPDLDSAHRWFLVDAAGEASKLTSVIVVGGWCSVLNNARPDALHHPGTKDVDLLFERGAEEGTLREVVESMIDRGYVPSAKHGFQLVRLAVVGDRELAFSVDLLHPTPGRVEAVGVEFSKHIDLGVEQSQGVDAEARVVSIGTPAMDLAFLHDLSAEHVVDGDNIRFLNDAGLILSKSKSVESDKRTRDSFDLFLAVTQPLVSNEQTIADLRRAVGRLDHDLSPACARDSRAEQAAETARHALGSLRDWLNGRGATAFGERVFKEVAAMDARIAQEGIDTGRDDSADTLPAGHTGLQSKRLASILDGGEATEPLLSVLDSALD